MEKIITLNRSNIDKEHICCAISDKKCKDSYELKKDWLKKEFDNGYIFRRIDARAKVFIDGIRCMISWISFGDLISKWLKSEKSNRNLGFILFGLMILSILMVWL